MSKKNPLIDAFLAKEDQWVDEMKKLRALALECDLTEELKWGKPCYMFEDRNVLITQPFKAHCALLFTKGALLKDAKGLLVKPGENTQAARQLRFTSTKEIADQKATIKAYILEAIELEKSGAEVTYLKSSELKYPVEFQRVLDKDAAVKAAFSALTPGRQRAYYLHFSAPKQSETRESRVNKCLPQILKGKGLND